MLRTRQTPAVPDPRLRWIGADPTLHLARTQVSEAALTDLSVLLLGEPGTGRGLAARTLHARSARRDRPHALDRCRIARPDGPRPRRHLLRRALLPPRHRARAPAGPAPPSGRPGPAGQPLHPPGRRPCPPRPSASSPLSPGPPTSGSSSASSKRAVSAACGLPLAPALLAPLLEAPLHLPSPQSPISTWTSTSRPWPTPN